MLQLKFSNLAFKFLCLTASKRVKKIVSCSLFDHDVFSPNFSSFLWCLGAGKQSGEMQKQ